VIIQVQEHSTIYRLSCSNEEEDAPEGSSPYPHHPTLGLFKFKNIPQFMDYHAQMRSRDGIMWMATYDFEFGD
jgi:hypothetical protein